MGINITKTKNSTDSIISGAINKQHSWLKGRRTFTRAFLKTLNTKNNIQKNIKQKIKSNIISNILSYWFPILCMLAVLIMILIVINTKNGHQTQKTDIIQQTTTESISIPTTQVIPSFDIVRIEKEGNIVIAGRGTPFANVSIKINKNIVATEHINSRGEFVYITSKHYTPGNYTIKLIDITNNIKSKDKVFIYVSEYGYKNSVSLLMTEEGSKLLQTPVLRNGDLIVSKIDYLDTGRLVITGKALPRLRVSLYLNNKYLGSTKVSDYKNFGIGININKLHINEKYTLAVKLHDTKGTIIANIQHEFTIPHITGMNDTFYTVRRGDSLWVIARNFLRKGILYTFIADCNNIINPNLIYPKQKLQIPVK